MPLPVALVLPDLFPDDFQPAGAQAGDWIEQFGFIRSDPGTNDGLPVALSPPITGRHPARRRRLPSFGSLARSVTPQRCATATAR